MINDNRPTGGREDNNNLLITEAARRGRQADGAREKGEEGKGKGQSLGEMGNMGKLTTAWAD